MSESENPHPALGGKSLETAMAVAGKPPYKSWRKKFRKMKVKFDAVLEENKKLFKEEQKLDSLARRLKEELDGLLEILVDLNENSAIPAELRYDISFAGRVKREVDLQQGPLIPDNVKPAEAHQIMTEYGTALQAGRLPPLDYWLIREHIHQKLARQGTNSIPVVDIGRDAKDHDPDGDPAYLTGEQEDSYLAYIDGERDSSLLPTASKSNHQAELTARELERQLELLNPQSQHNWLRTHSKSHPVIDEEEALASEQAVKSAKKRPSGKNFARQVMMDRMVRDGFSPSEVSHVGDDDEETMIRKRSTDTTSRSKSTKNGGSTKSKRKRTTDEGSGGGGKRARASDVFV